MTGTGVQNDPYIPTTLTEFITAVGTAGAYVALTQDINAAEDPAYIGVVATPIWRARYFDGGSFEIAGVTVSGQQMIYHGVDGTEARDFRLRDWAFKPINQTPAIFCGYRGTSGNTWRNVSASVKVDLGGFPPLAFCDAMVCHDSAFNIRYTGGNMTGLVFDWNVQMHRCTILFDGIPLPDGPCCASGCTFDRSAIIYKNTTIPSGAGIMASGSTWEGSYVAVLDPQAYPLKSGSGSTVLRSIIAGVEGQAISGDAIAATLAQMRDEAWLASVGFLP